MHFSIDFVRSASAPSSSPPSASDTWDSRFSYHTYVSDSDTFVTSLPDCTQPKFSVGVLQTLSVPVHKFHSSPHRKSAAGRIQLRQGDD